jgi:CCR4-NOT transcription complex subunit 9
MNLNSRAKLSGFVDDSLSLFFLHPVGLNYVCATAERFYAVGTVLSNMVQLLQVHPSVRLLKHVVRCYLRLADHPRAREALKTCLPQSLRDNTFGPHLHNDPTVQKWLSQLLQVVGQNADGSDAASTAPTVGTSLSASTLGDN